MRKLSYKAACLIVLSCLVAGYLASFFFVRKLRPREFKRELAAIDSLYEANDYRRAIAAYESLAARYNIQCMTLFYNLGNAYYKTNNLGHAILYYTKAQRLAPRDHDVNTNLRVAQMKAQVTVHPEEPSPRTLGRKLLRLFSLFEGVAASLTFRWLLTIFVVLTIFFGRKRRYFVRSCVGLAVLFYVCLGATMYKAYLQKTYPQGVILEKEIPLRIKPTEDGPTQTVLSAGTAVQLQRRHNGWCKISTDDGDIGWIKEDTIGEI